MLNSSCFYVSMHLHKGFKHEKSHCCFANLECQNLNIPGNSTNSFKLQHTFVEGLAIFGLTAAFIKKTIFTALTTQI